MKKILTIVSSLALALSVLVLPMPSNAVPLTDGLAGYWNFEEGSGVIANDLAHDNDGTLNGDAAYSSDVQVLPTNDYSLTFDGSGDYVQVPNDSELEPSNITVSAWVKSTNPGAYKYVLSKGASGCTAASYALYTGGSGGLYFYIFNGSSGALSPGASAASVWDGNWHHVAGTFDGSYVRLYVDGVQVGTGISTSISIGYGLSTTNDLFFGRYNGSCVLQYPGKLDEVRIYDRALSATEVDSLHDYDFGVTLSPTADYNPVGSEHIVTATIDPALSYIPVLFEVSGANSDGGTINTTGVGEAVFTYTGLNAGTDIITACVDADRSGFCDDGEITATATKYWLDKFVTGGGNIKELGPTITTVRKGIVSYTQSVVTKYTFGGNVGIDVDGDFVGQFQINDHEEGMACHFNQINSFMFVDSETAKFNATGNCNDGEEKIVDVTIADRGEPGAGIDEITVEGDIEFGSPITGGNFQVRFPAEFLLLRLYEKNPSGWSIVPGGALPEC